MTPLIFKYKLQVQFQKVSNVVYDERGSSKLPAVKKYIFYTSVMAKKFIRGCQQPSSFLIFENDEIYFQIAVFNGSNKCMNLNIPIFKIENVSGSNPKLYPYSMAQDISESQFEFVIEKFRDYERQKFKYCEIFLKNSLCFKNNPEKIPKNIKKISIKNKKSLKKIYFQK